MTYAVHHDEFTGYYRAAKHARAHKGLLQRIFDALYDSQLRRAEKDIGRYVARSGGRLTDDIERRMMRQLTTSGWNANG